MAEPDQDPGPQMPAIKVQRERRRIYEQPEPPPETDPAEQTAQDDHQAPDTPSGGEEQQTEKAGQRIIKRYTAMAACAGLIPAPVVDILALGALQLLLIRDLARIYDVTFSRARGQALLGALLGSTGSVSVATGYLGSLVKTLPVLGHTAGAAMMPALGGAATLALGRVFQRHFAAGGNLWDLNPRQKKDEMARELAQARSDLGKAG